MAKRLIINVDGPSLVVDAAPLSREAFAAFGDVVENPRPDLHPSAAAAAAESLPFNAISANQGTAIKYQHVTRTADLTSQAPSGRPGVSVANMFVCAARTLQKSNGIDVFPVAVLERHPYTTQTFIPLSADPNKRYLVIVAPSLAPSKAGQHLPVPASPPSAPSFYERQLPGRGLPDLRGLRAFIATSEQAVTYGAGTWHSPMVALGPANTALDFLVTQFASGVPIEDCQEVYLETAPGAAGGVIVRLPTGLRLSKL